MTTVFGVEGLSVEFPGAGGPVRAVDGVNLRIDSGRILGLVGESGAGKSVTGAAVLGLVDPPGEVVGGVMRFGDEAIDPRRTEAFTHLRGAGVSAIFQDPLAALDPLMSIGDQLVETVRAHARLSAAAARERAVGLLHEAGIADARACMRRYPHQLSGGMRQRAVIALALAPQPKLIVADEPTTALDVSTQARILQLIRRIAHRHRTAFLLITHDLGVVAAVADQVAVMYAGRIVECGPTREVLDEPAHPYTRGLLRALPSLGRPGPRPQPIPGMMPRLGALPPGCAFEPRCAWRVERCRKAPQPSLIGAVAHQVACWQAATHSPCSRPR